MSSRRYSASYVNHSSCFRIDGLPDRSGSSEWSSVLKVVLNILQRGTPTPTPQRLQDAYGAVALSEPSGRQLAFPPDTPSWSNTILGDSQSTNNPASALFHQWLPEALGTQRNLLWWVAPEVLISGILGRELPQFTNQRVDFYIPACRLVLEVDGPHHDTPKQQLLDLERNQLLERSGIRTERIRTDNLAKPAFRDAWVKNIAKILTDTAATIPWITPEDANFAPEQSLVLALRLQITIIELMLCNKLPVCGKPWHLTIATDTTHNWWDPALHDLFDWITPIATLAGLSWTPPELEIGLTKPGSTDNGDVITIDIDARRRWTDQCITSDNFICVRSAYIDTTSEYYHHWIPAKYFKVESDNPITYRIKTEAENKSLNDLVLRLFGHKGLRPGQERILKNVLSRRDTIGILPTGGGKSLCFQLAALLQPGITLVVSPLKSLMRDQCAELDLAGINRAASINSDDSPEKKKLLIDDFINSRIQILFISPERLQIPDFRDACTALSSARSLQHAVVDEVHCLSEWGHDFRTSYLNLANTFRNYLSGGVIVALTATASKNVMKDIQKEFQIDDQDVMYGLNLKRENLTFQILRGADSQISRIGNWISDQNARPNAPSCGIVFTPYVNGERGCLQTANELQNHTGQPFKFFSGKKPNKYPGTVKEYEKEKIQNQDDFKKGTLKFLCATKAFGMGFNKPDVRFTIHYGFPSSMESLYQEAGRAGRDEKPADCLVAISGHDPELSRVLDERLSPLELKKTVQKYQQSNDLSTQLYLIVNDLRTIGDDFQLLLDIVKYLRNNDLEKTEVTARTFQHGKETASVEATQMAIYRLTQLGYLDDWTVTDFINGDYLVDLGKWDDEAAEEKLLKLVRGYSGLSSIVTLSDIFKDDPEYWQKIVDNGVRPRMHVLLLTLLKWSYEHFNYARRQSLKSVMEVCNNEALSPTQIREALERYFEINNLTGKIQGFIDSDFERIEEWSRFVLGTDQEEDLSAEQNYKQYLLGIKGQLTRLLESYQSNPALDLLSAAVRLLLGEYAHPDASGRVKFQLSRTVHSQEKFSAIRQFLYRVGVQTNQQNRAQLAKDIIDCAPTRELALEVHCNLADVESMHRYIDFIGTDLSSLRRSIEYGF